MLKSINYIKNLFQPIFGWCMRRPNCTESCLSRRCLLHLITPITMVRRVFTVVTWKSIGHEFFPPSLSPPKKPCCPLQKKKVWLFICEVKLSFFFYCNVFSLDLFIELICFFNFISWHLIFIYDLVLILLIEIYLVLNHLLSYFFLFHTFTLDFCIRFYFYSFNYGVFGLESLIKLICLWISNIILTDPHFFYC